MRKLGDLGSFRSGVDLYHGLFNGHAEGGLAVHDGAADLEFCEVAAEVLCPEPLAPRRLGLDP